MSCKNPCGLVLLLITLIYKKGNIELWVRKTEIGDVKVVLEGSSISFDPPRIVQGMTK